MLVTGVRYNAGKTPRQDTAREKYRILVCGKSRSQNGAGESGDGMGWRIVLMVATALTLVGCSGQGVSECESFLKAKLKTPSTYSRANVRSAVIPDKKHGPYLSVLIDYDAQNEYGAMIRETQVCSFPMKNGRPDFSRYIDHDNVFSGDFGPFGNGTDTVNPAEEAVRNAEAAVEEAMANYQSEAR